MAFRQETHPQGSRREIEKDRSGPTRLEPPPENTGETGFSEKSGAKSGALETDSEVLPSKLPADLRVVVNALPYLSSEDRKRILRIVREAGARVEP